MVHSYNIPTYFLYYRPPQGISVMNNDQITKFKSMVLIINMKNRKHTSYG